MSKVELKARNRNLDLVKILACVFVIGLHSLNYPKQPVLYTLYQAFGYAIPCFFMASGYMLLNKKSVSRKYVVGKILRVVRFVLMWNILWYGLQFAKAVVTGEAGFAAIAGYIMDCIKAIPQNCFLQRGFFFQFWYLGTTIILYMLLPLLYRARLSEKDGAAHKHNGLLWIWIILLVVSFALQAMSMILGFPVQKKVLQSLRLWSALQYFLAGGFMPGIINGLKQKITLKKHAALLALSAIASLAFRMAIGVKCINNTYAEFFYDDPLFMVSSYLLFAFIMRLNLPGFVQKTVDSLSPLIMGVYAVHMIMIKILKQIVPSGGTLSRLGMFIACTVICFGVIKLLKIIRPSKYWLEL